jgi:hypothetical protein
MMNRPPWKTRVDQLSSRWLDGLDDDTKLTDESDEPSWKEDRVQHYLADVLLVEALLANMSDRVADEREDRIRKVMEAIHESAPSPRPRARFPRWPSLVAVAACLMIAVTLSWIQFSRHSLANEVLLAVNEVSSEATDRVYTIRRVLPGSDERDPPQGKLYLRGRSGFVITFGQVVLGRDADQFWLVAPDNKVTLSDSFHWIDAHATGDELGLRFMQELSLESRHIPLMQLASVAELMRHDYDVTLSHDRLGHREADLLMGQRRSSRSELPAVIRLWSDTDSRIIRRAELSWEPSNAIILELVPAEPVSLEWYSYRAHCHGTFAVRRIPPP